MRKLRNPLQGATINVPPLTDKKRKVLVSTAFTAFMPKVNKLAQTSKMHL